MATNKIEQNQGTDMLQIKDLVNICISNWYWFLLSILVCLGIAEFKILKTTPTYSRTMTVMIKPNNVQKYSSSDLDQILSKNGMTGSNTKLANEKISLKSISLMEEVVRRADLNIRYYVDGGMHRDILYGKNLPVKTDLLDIPENEHVSFSINKTLSGYALSNFSKPNISEEESSKTINCSLLDTLMTPIGRIVLEPSDNFFANEERWPIFVDHSNVHSIANMFSSRLSIVEADKESDVINISIEDISAQRAEDILNGVINVYNENWVNDRNQVAVSTSKFIAERLATLERDLGSVDDDISSFKSRNLMPAIGSTSEMYITQSSDMMRRIQEVDDQLYMANFIKDYLRNSSSKNQLIPPSMSIDNSNISAQIGTYNQMLLKRNSLVANSSETNPLVVDMDSSLASLRTALVSSVNGQITTLTAQKATLKKNEARANEKIAATPNQAKYLLNVERQRKVKESLYLFLLQKHEENELGQAFSAYNTRIINPPIGSNSPIAPVKARILLIALLIGLCIPVVIFYIIKITDTKIRTRMDLDGLSAPFIGEIPQLMDSKSRFTIKKDAAKRDIKLYVKHGRRDVLNEAFRVLRTSLEFMSENKPCNKIVITSFNVGSGKSFISLNLAAALSINGKKVLAVDTDLRHASLSKAVGSPKSGISNYLAGQIDDIHKTMVQHEECKTLDILPVGTIPPNPSELISNRRFEELISSLEKEYEYIIFDCPPIDIVADTQIVEKYADRTLFIVRSGLLDKSMLNELEDIYVQNKFKKISIILNGSGSDGSLYGYHSSYRYSYKYGYSYHHYGYNYYSDSETGKKKKKK